MTVWIIAFLSVTVTALFYIIGFIHGALWAPLLFLGCFLALLLLFLLPCVIYSLFVDLNKPCVKPSRFMRFYGDRMIDMVIMILRVKLTVTGKELLPKEKFLLVGNHRSQMDPILEMGAFREYNLGLVSKRELFKVPILNKIIHKRFCLPLDRKNAKNGKTTIMRAAEIIKSQCASIGIYPEGTCRAEPELLPFKTGAFKIAQQAECAIAVVIIQNSELVAKRAPFGKTNVFVRVVGVIGAEEVKECKTAQLSERVRDMMTRALETSKNAVKIMK